MDSGLVPDLGTEIDASSRHLVQRWCEPTYPMMRLSEYSFLLEKESVKLKKLRAGSTTARRGTAGPSRGGARVIRIPHDDRYLRTQGEAPS